MLSGIFLSTEFGIEAVDIGEAPGLGNLEDEEQQEDPAAYDSQSSYRSEQQRLSMPEHRPSAWGT